MFVKMEWELDNILYTRTVDHAKLHSENSRYKWTTIPTPCCNTFSVRLPQLMDQKKERRRW
jgi:hypothetical protein